MRAASDLPLRRVMALLVVAATVLYAVLYLDPYIGLLMAPFFILGSARGKHPLTLLALSAIPAFVLLAGSAMKFRLTGVPLVTYDHHFLQQNILLLIYNDWRIAIAAIVAIAATLLYIKHLFMGKGAFSRFEAAAAVALTLISIACIVGLWKWDQTINNWESELAAPSLRTFVASAVMPRPHLRVTSEASAASPPMETPAELGQGLTAPEGTLPDIFLVLQESTFHPGVVRAGYEPHALFTKSKLPSADGYSGILHVHTFAGATWKTEFAVTTQMRPQEFGNDGLYVFYQLAERIKQSTFTRLKALGYRTVVFYPVPGNFINARNFYTSIGVDEFYDPESLGISKGWDWQIADSRLYDAMLKKIGESDGPVVAMMLTINQHGPHDSGDPIADYIARFEQSDDAYGVFLDALAQRGRKAGVITFGDHQPDFMANLHERAAWYFTAYDIRCVSFACSGTAIPARGDKALDAVMLAPLALQEFGFKLDGFSSLERRLFWDCDDDVSLCGDAARLGVNDAFAKFFY